MWLWYDWQAAAVADDDGIIHDSAVWDGFFDQRALIERLHCIANGGLTQEARLLQDRFPDAKATIHGDPKLPKADWPLSLIKIKTPLPSLFISSIDLCNDSSLLP